ncbi:MAG: hypothetical protein E7532_08360 [Ruminococcaceae bacterium]|nr:hypothetical protein [Oscillospiraceae bacterium]
MKKLVNGKHVELTPEEINAIEQQKADYWKNVDYDEAVNAEIRNKYTESQEFAILRQREEKPTEYEEYYSYCEKCKAFVKEKKAKYSETVGEV